MNEFWALVLGSLLAVIGGIIGTIFTQWLSNIKDRRKDRKDAYEDILQFCYRLKYVYSKYAQNVSYDYLTEILSRTRLYASDKVLEEYIKIHNLASELLDLNKDNDKNKIEDLREVLNAHIDVISAQMKKEIKLGTKKSKQLLEMTLYKRNKEKRKNGN